MKLTSNVEQSDEQCAPDFGHVDTILPSVAEISIPIGYSCASIPTLKRSFI